MRCDPGAAGDDATVRLNDAIGKHASRVETSDVDHKPDATFRDFCPGCNLPGR